MPANKIAADVAVLAEDVAEVAQTEAVEVVTVVKNNPFLLAGVALVAATAGGFAGYKWAERKLTLKFDEALEQEIQATRNILGKDVVAEEIDEVKFEENPQLDELEKKIVRSVRNYQQTPVRHDKLKVVEKTIEVELDEDDQGGEDPRSDAPYRISFNDYHSQDDPNWTQLALTYYAKDDTLADEDDEVSSEVGATIGVDALDHMRRTGIETMFVRNPKTQLDFEVARYERSYLETTQG